MRRPLVVVSISVAVVLILTGVAYLFLSKPPATEPQPRGSSTNQPTSAKESKPPPEQSTLSFKQGIENIKNAIDEVCTTGESKELTLVFTEAEANEQAAKLLAQTEIPEDIPLEVESIRVDLKAGNTVVTEVKSVTYGFKITIEVTVLVITEDGKPKVEVTNVNFGIVPLPQPVKDRITAFVTQEIDNLLNRLLNEVSTGCDGGVDLEFTEIDIQENKVTIIVVVRPTV